MSVDSSTSTTSARVGSTSSEDSRPEDWCIEALVDQLIGDDPTVASVALSVLEEAIQDERCLRSLVGKAIFSRPGGATICLYLSGGADVFPKLHETRAHGFGFPTS